MSNSKDNCSEIQDYLEDYFKYTKSPGLGLFINFVKSKIGMSENEPLDEELAERLKHCYSEYNKKRFEQNAGAPSKVTVNGKSCTVYVKVNGEFMTVKQANKMLSKKASSSKKSSVSPKKTPSKRK